MTVVKIVKMNLTLSPLKLSVDSFDLEYKGLGPTEVQNTPKKEGKTVPLKCIEDFAQNVLPLWSC